MFQHGEATFTSCETVRSENKPNALCKHSQTLDTKTTQQTPAVTVLQCNASNWLSPDLHIVRLQVRVLKTDPGSFGLDLDLAAADVICGFAAFVNLTIHIPSVN